MAYGKDIPFQSKNSSLSKRDPSYQKFAAKWGKNISKGKKNAAMARAEEAKASESEAEDDEEDDDEMEGMEDLAEAVTKKLIMRLAKG